MNLKDLRAEANSRYLEALRYNRLVQSDLFEFAYNKATDEEKKQLEKPGPQIHKILKKDLDNQPITSLRQLGKKYHVMGYHTLPKTVLIEEIKDAIRKIENITPVNVKVR